MARSLRKGPYVDPSLQRKVDKLSSGGSKSVIKTWSRRSMITPEFVGLTFHVHNGKLFMPVFVTENMVGHSWVNSRRPVSSRAMRVIRR